MEKYTSFNKLAYRRLWLKVEQAKKVFSSPSSLLASKEKFDIVLPSFKNGKDFQLTLTREWFNNLALTMTEGWAQGLYNFVKKLALRRPKIFWLSSEINILKNAFQEKFTNDFCYTSFTL